MLILTHSIQMSFLCMCPSYMHVSPFYKSATLIHVYKKDMCLVYVLCIEKTSMYTTYRNAQTDTEKTSFLYKTYRNAHTDTQYTDVFIHRKDIYV